MYKSGSPSLPNLTSGRVSRRRQRLLVAAGEARGVRRREPHPQTNLVVADLAFDYLAVAVQPGERGPVPRRETDVEHPHRGGEALVEKTQQVVAPLAGARRQDDGATPAARHAIGERLPLLARHQIDLVE